MFNILRIVFPAGFTRSICAKLAAIGMLLLMPTYASAELEINVLNPTPIGSWAVREDITTDHRGRQMVTVVRSSMLSSEERNGQKYYWVEMVMDSFKLKKGKRKKSGDRVITKTLISEAAFKADPANSVQNMRGVGDEMIMQQGNSKPMRMSGANNFAQGLMEGMGVEVTYDYKSQGKEEVTVPAGSFTAHKLQGSGSTSMKMLFKTMNVVSNNTSYYSDKVPFGIVKVDGDSTTNGKASTHQSVLLEYGTSGATSLITETPQDIPAMPNMKDLLGGGNG